MSIQVKMKNDYILVKDLNKEEVTKGGIIIPINEKWNRRAVVMTAGDCNQVKKGDIVLKNLGKGTRMILNGIEMEMIHVNSILCVIKNNS